MKDQVVWVDRNPGHRVIRGDYTTFITCLVNDNEFTTQDNEVVCPYCGQRVVDAEPLELWLR